MQSSQVAELADAWYKKRASQASSNHVYFIIVFIAYSAFHGFSGGGKNRLHIIMRYVLPGDLMWTLWSSDNVPLLILVVKIVVLICAFFQEEFIPMLTKSLWTKVFEYTPVVWKCLRDNARVVWQWLCDKAPAVWQGVRELLSDVCHYLAEHSVATERGRREALVPGARSRSPSPHGRYGEQEDHQLLLMNVENHSAESGQGVGLSLSDGRASSQGVEQEIEPDTVMQAINPEPSAEEEGNRYQLVCVPSIEPQVPRVVSPAVPHFVQSFQMSAPDWNYWRKNPPKNPPKKRNRDKDLEPERAAKDEDLEPERAGKKPRI